MFGVVLCLALIVAWLDIRNLTLFVDLANIEDSDMLIFIIFSLFFFVFIVFKKTKMYIILYIIIFLLLAQCFVPGYCKKSKNYNVDPKKTTKSNDYRYLDKLCNSDNNLCSFLVTCECYVVKLLWFESIQSR